MADLSCIPKFVKQEIVNGWVGETWKLMLLSKDHVPNPGTQQYISQVSNYEITDAAGKYPPGGVSIGTKACLADGNNYYLDMDDVTIGPGSYLTFQYIVLYKDTGNPATSPIRVQIDMLTDQVVTNGTCVIHWDINGVIYIQ